MKNEHVSLTVGLGADGALRLLSLGNPATSSVRLDSGADTLSDLKEIGPTYFFAPPRIWENILTAVMIRVEDAWAPKRAMIRYFLDLARRTERARLAHRTPALGDRLLYALGRVLVYGPLRDNLGMGRIRLA